VRDCTTILNEIRDNELKKGIDLVMENKKQNTRRRKFGRMSQQELAESNMYWDYD